jgi:hypothetical protein
VAEDEEASADVLASWEEERRQLDVEIHLFKN